MTDLVQTIKRAAIEAVASGLPAEPCIATVVSEEPLTLRLNQRLTLTGRRLLFLDGLPELEEDDRLALLRFPGGQQYLVLGVLQ